LLIWAALGVAGVIFGRAKVGHTAAQTPAVAA